MKAKKHRLVESKGARGTTTKGGGSKVRGELYKTSQTQPNSHGARKQRVGTIRRILKGKQVLPTMGWGGGEGNKKKGK